MINRWKCTNKQTGHTLILTEQDAFDLDIRVWSIVQIATSGNLNMPIRRVKPICIGMILTTNRKGTFDLTRLTVRNYWQVLSGLQLIDHQTIQR